MLVAALFAYAPHLLISAAILVIGILGARRSNERLGWGLVAGAGAVGVFSSLWSGVVFAMMRSYGVRTMSTLMELGGLVSYAGSACMIAGLIVLLRRSR